MIAKKINSSKSQWPKLFAASELMLLLLGFFASQLLLHYLFTITPSFSFDFELDSLRFRFTSLAFEGLAFFSVFLLVFFFRYEYGPRKFFTGLPNFQFVFETWFWGISFFLLISALTKLDFSRIYMLFTAISVLIFSVLARFLARKAVVLARSKGSFSLTTLLVTNSTHWRLEAQGYLENAGLGVSPSLVYTGQLIWALEASRWRKIGTSKNFELTDFVKSEQNLDLILVLGAGSLRDDQLRVMSLISHQRGIPLLVEPGTKHFAEERLSSLTMGTRKLLSVSKPNLNIGQRLTKRILDIMVSLSLIVVLSPVLAFIVIVQMLVHGTPLFFTQERIGRHGEPFLILKFRTMPHDVGVSAVKYFQVGRVAKGRIKHLDDNEITSFGKFMRRHSIDELPQLINVLLGHMSLVGPRPQVALEVEQYEKWEKQRLEVRPGMTGLWQVSGRSELGWEESVALDLEYVENWSTSRDFVILLKTVRAVLKPEGAR
jgi:exopolysaccharide biosynthesis polyprenyl glycosylphosphotransferase